MISRIKSINCEYNNSTQQLYNDILLPISTDFFSCLAKMLEYDEIEGYNCTHCNNKVNIHKY